MHIKKRTKAIAWIFTRYMAASKLKMAASVFVGFLLFLLIVACEMKGILDVCSWFFVTCKLMEDNGLIRCHIITHGKG